MEIMRSDSSRSKESIESSANGINILIDEEINVGNIAYYAKPVADYIGRLNPDYIIGLDRGARVFSFATHAVYNRLYGKLPTIDGTIIYRRVSNSKTFAENKKILKPLIDEILENGGNGKVLVVDDLISSGETKEIILRIFEDVTNGRITPRFVTFTSHIKEIEFRDNSNLIGVNKDGTPIKDKSNSIKYRKDILKNVEDFVKSCRVPVPNYNTLLSIDIYKKQTTARVKELLGI